MHASQPTPTEHRSPAPAKVNWPRVARASYQVCQTYSYTYSAPVWDVKQRLVMVPPDRHGDQVLLSHYTEVRGSSGSVEQTWSRDAFGNRQCEVRLERVEHVVEFEATYRVERSTSDADAAPATLPIIERWGGHDGLLRHTALTAPDDRLRAVAATIAAATTMPIERADLAHDWAARAITYQFGVTGVQTPAAMALHLGRGVCQDYAHILLCLLRLCGIPARYVSGHLLGEGAPHAWVEALVENRAPSGGLQVIAYDPTHHRRGGLNYITVAVGRDFADVTPTSGYFSGPASGALAWSKRAELVALDYLDDPVVDETAA